MRVLIRVFAAAALAACSGSATAPDVTTPAASKDAITTTDGPLKLTVSDALAQPGMMFIAGTVVGGQRMITVSSTRYGSLCSTSITAHADAASGTITLSVKYLGRLTDCVAGIRAITYRAEIGSLPAGTYDVKVVHSNGDATASTVLTERVKVT